MKSLEENLASIVDRRGVAAEGTGREENAERTSAEGMRREETRGTTHR